MTENRLEESEEGVERMSTGCWKQKYPEGLTRVMICTKLHILPISLKKDIIVRMCCDVSTC